jgi:hypothetical protein
MSVHENVTSNTSCDGPTTAGNRIPVKPRQAFAAVYRSGAVREIVFLESHRPEGLLAGDSDVPEHLGFQLKLDMNRGSQKQKIYEYLWPAQGLRLRGAYPLFFFASGCLSCLKSVVLYELYSFSHAKMIISMGLTCYFCIPWHSFYHSVPSSSSKFIPSFITAKRSPPALYSQYFSFHEMASYLFDVFFFCRSRDGTCEENVNTMFQYGGPHSDLDLGTLGEL